MPLFVCLCCSKRLPFRKADSRISLCCVNCVNSGLVPAAIVFSPSYKAMIKTSRKADFNIKASLEATNAFKKEWKPILMKVYHQHLKNDDDDVLPIETAGAVPYPEWREVEAMIEPLSPEEHQVALKERRDVPVEDMLPWWLKEDLLV